MWDHQKQQQKNTMNNQLSMNLKDKLHLMRNCKVGKVCPADKYQPGKICMPQPEFDMIESCMICDKKL